MKAWQYRTGAGGLEKSLHLNTSATLPKVKADQHLVRILATALNPVDYKPAEVALIHRLAIPKPATPGIDFVGRVVKPAVGSHLQPNQLIFGAAAVSPLAGGALAEYAVVPTKGATAVPDGLDPVDAATVCVAGLTAYQTIIPHVKTGSRVFINGGSGGTGIFGIQIAKAAGCHVTTSCSTTNVELCKSLGADEVLDYKQGSILEQLKKQSPVFDHVVDNVGYDYDLYWRSHEYTKPDAKFIYVGARPDLSYLAFSLKVRLWPGFLGGGKRKFESMLVEPRTDELKQIGQWMVEGKVKAMIDQKFPFEQAVEAFKKLKTGRARGKIIVEGTPE